MTMPKPTTAGFKLPLAVAAALFAAVAAAAELPELSTYEEWSAAYGKPALPERRAVFAANLAMIAGHNAKHDRGETTFRMGLNAFADLTADEIKAKVSNPAMRNSNRDHRAEAATVLPLPINVTAVDWRTKGAVTPVGNEGACGACWVFAATGAIESAYFIATGVLRSLSVQQVMDCSRDCSHDACGCEGGLPSAAFRYVLKNGGIDTTADYNYTQISIPCDTVQEKRVAAKIEDVVNVPSFNESQLLAAVTQQPVSVGIDASGDGFTFYKSGILDNATSGAGCADIQCLNHAVLVVGYGTDNGTDYWLVKNSWGVAWGESGYIRMLRNYYDNSGEDNGLLGIAVLPVYPSITKGPPLPLPPPTPPHPSPRPKSWCGNCGENCESLCRQSGYKCDSQTTVAPVTCNCNPDPNHKCQSPPLHQVQLPVLRQP